MLIICNLIRLEVLGKAEQNNTASCCFYSKAITMALVRPLKEAINHNLTIYSGCPDERKAHDKGSSEISSTPVTLYELLIVVVSQTCSNNWFQ